METRKLRYVVTVAEELSFTRAAVRLHMTQPPLSKQIKEVESELGVRLFERTKRVVQLTKAGEVFVERARLLLRDLDQLRHVSGQADRGEAGQLTIGFLGAIAFDLFPRILREYRAQVPDVRIELLESDNHALMDGLRSRRIDAAFMRPYYQDADISMKTLLLDQFVVALPTRHRLAGRKAISIRDLAEEPFVTASRSPAPSIYAQTMAICEKAGFHPHVTQASTHLHTAIALVSAGMGIALVPRSIMNLGLQGVSYAKLNDVSETIEVVVAWRNNDRNAVLSRFLRLAEQIARRR
jgi:DNA-binding transcriptional LysR family regulator